MIFLHSTVKFAFLACLWGSVAVTGYTQFEKECLEEHNRLRAIHGAPPLTLDENLNKFAQEWANHLRKIRKLKHRTQSDYGENLFRMSGARKISGSTAVRAWYNEIKDYKYGSDFSRNTGHFTQVIWKESKQLGCAVARRGQFFYVVANYSPAGNVQSEFLTNVLPPKE